MAVDVCIPYSRKIWRFGSLYYNRQIKIRQNFLLAYIRMAIPYRTAILKSANILLIAISSSTAKFNARQYFRLYGIPYRVNSNTQNRMILLIHLHILHTKYGQTKYSYLNNDINWIYTLADSRRFVRLCIYMRKLGKEKLL